MLASLFEKAGFEVEASKDIRSDIWYKLWGNMTMNPVSAITGASVDRIMADPLVMEAFRQQIVERLDGSDSGPVTLGVRAAALRLRSVPDAVEIEATARPAPKALGPAPDETP